MTNKMTFNMQNTPSCAYYVLKRRLNEHLQVFSVFKKDNNSTQNFMKAADRQKMNFVTKSILNSLENKNCLSDIAAPSLWEGLERKDKGQMAVATKKG